MGFESEIVNVENDQYTHVVFEDFYIKFENDEDYDDDEDEEWNTLYEELWEETPHIEYDWYEENLEHPDLIPVARKRYRNMPTMWVPSYYERV